jgi:hypothetical protein
MNGIGFSNCTVTIQSHPIMLKTPICKNMNDMSGTGKWQTKINELSNYRNDISIKKLKRKT